MSSLCVKQNVCSTEEAYAAYTASRAAAKQELQNLGTIDAELMPSSAKDT